ncbi:c-type cytochrome [Chitinophaga nivalis]|uniref:Photosynthetic reaction center cytochrome c subunit n=1 Tax=Chitinophaga nivalis TaxID=2991709 RepID=A0ABT3IT30_9BACT|nr:c-type cytochrome [Chitinophaga nivalis]MCW3463430.1 c-type cytochrome [Chitinophaga nivalis]MCW3486880.1 c-type cytochrome [Chitinophaga nivalis]
MRIKNTFAVAAAFVVAGSLCSLSLPAAKEGPANLKVLPKNIPHEELMTVMRGFNTALGVKCGFCHAQQKEDAKKLDFASDANPHKDVARDMMRMTRRINRKFFRESETMTITCYSCHHGNETPKSKPDVPEAK